ncbi:DNA cytosine methyltransferase [uncultured Jatrophihabitans sp.]|uniref:DNA cytosine methyltransferase n=1 Tax=uncultured Jatrophihabitans sp. TaxID=1610747 RepID=UPI0035CC8585
MTAGSATRTRLVSLCTGYGGLDMAVQAVLNVDIVAHCDIDPAASRLLAYHWPDISNLGDLTTLSWCDYRPDIVTAGYPCQPFSLAGRRQGADDERHLWPSIAAGIRRVRPRLVFLENVAGHRTLGLDAVLGDLAADGYDATWTSIRAADIGAPHGRERIFILAADTSGGLCDWRQRQSGERPSQRAIAAGDRARSGERAVAEADGARSQGREPAAGRHVSARSAAADTGSDRPLRGAEQHVGAVDRQRESQRRDADRRAVRRQSYPKALAADPRLDWGKYGHAVRRWEQLTRPAPLPTEAATFGGQRLNPWFVEWMQGLPAGHVCAVPDLTRSEQLRLLGSGVVPQQGAAALSWLLAHLETAAA